MTSKFPDVSRKGQKISLTLFGIALTIFSAIILTRFISGFWTSKSENQSYREIQIPENGLTELIEIPPGRCFWIEAPGWLDYYFLTQKGYIHNFGVSAGEQKRSSKIFPSSRFKLKGQAGAAKIRLEPCRR